MRILLTGANGFLGRYVLAALAGAGHRVVPAVRNVEAARHLSSGEAPLQIDFNRDTHSAGWLPRLAGIDAVINCAGVLQATRGQSIEAIHTLAPQALFAACEQAGVRRVIQISAISADAGAGTDYAASKLAGDTLLKKTNLDWVIVRPSLVVAPGAYGGTALLRALASLPFVVPLVGKGEQLFQPVHIGDVTECILRILADPGINRQVIDPVGPDVLTLRDIVLGLRRWLGYGAARILEVPLALIGPLAWLGDRVGGPLSTTSLRQLEYGNTGDAAAFTRATGIVPQSWSMALAMHPSQWQDRWHARLYFLRPILRTALALMWIASGVIGLLQPATIMQSLLGACSLPVETNLLLARLACALDIVIGIALLARWKPAWMAGIQLALVAAYSVFLSMVQPALWLDPFGPLLKNLPIAVAILVLAALEQDR
jgi:uncharacterized protein YbjT (DUF2867 family)